MSKFCTLSPDRIPVIRWIDIGHICDRHDRDYRNLYNKSPTYRNKARRANYDYIFWQSLVEDGVPLWIAAIYYRAVRCFGWIGLWKRKR